MRLLFSLLGTFIAACAGAPQAAPPNIVVVFTDDQGWGDLGCHGAVGFTTPCLDRLAAEGTRFTDFVTAAASCSPSRAALLTGCYPQRVGIPHVLGPRSRIGLAEGETTLAEVLGAQGYATLCVGKWHLGHREPFLPMAHGFDAWFGLPYSNDMTPDPELNPNPRARRHPPLPLMRGAGVVETAPDQSTLTRRYTEEALAFVRRNADRPFFLYLAHTFPHTPLHAAEEFRGRTRRGLYGDVIAEIDASTGRLMAAVEELGLTGRTVFVFSSDNGPWLIKGADGGSAGPFREGKGTTFEGGHRVPFLVRWPGRVPAGRVCAEPVTALDVAPTLAAWAGAPWPHGRTDGRDVRALLEGRGEPEEDHEFYYYVGRRLQAVRRGRWKLHLPHGYRTLEGGRLATPDFFGRYGRAEIGLSLFDLATDPGERHDVADRHPDIVEELRALAERARNDLGDGRDREGSGVRPPGRVEAR